MIRPNNIAVMYRKASSKYGFVNELVANGAEYNQKSQTLKVKCEDTYIYYILIYSPNTLEAIQGCCCGEVYDGVLYLEGDHHYQVINFMNTRAKRG